MGWGLRVGVGWGGELGVGVGGGWGEGGVLTSSVFTIRWSQGYFGV